MDLCLLEIISSNFPMKMLRLAVVVERKARGREGARVRLNNYFTGKVEAEYDAETAGEMELAFNYYYLKQIYEW